MQLNSIQQEAATTLDQDVSLVAGAGTGKTRVLTERFIHIAKSQQGRYDNIVAITFTKKAAAEMKSRIVQGLIAEDITPSSKHLNIQTIHSFCEGVLREFAIDLGINPAFEVIEEQKQNELIHQALEQTLEEIETEELKHFFIDFHKTIREVKQDFIFLNQEMKNQNIDLETLRKSTYQDHSSGDSSLLKDKLRQLEEYCGKKTFGKYAKTGAYQEFMNQEEVNLNLLEDVISHLGRSSSKKGVEKTPEQDREDLLRVEIKQLASSFYLQKDRQNFVYYEAIFQVEEHLERQYAKLKEEHSFMDFHDLILGMRSMLKIPKVRNLLQERYRYVMVDEFQDTDPLQNEILAALDPINLFIVGDPKQSIYRFRGSDIHSYYELASQVAESGKELLMMTNYRSISGLVEQVNLIFEKMMNPYDALEAFQQQQGVIEKFHMEEDGQLEGLLATLLEQYELKDIAILARSWSLIGKAEKILNSLHIPSVHTRKKLCDFPVVKAVVQLIRAVGNGENILDFLGFVASDYTPFSYDTIVSILNAKPKKVEEILSLNLSEEKWSALENMYCRLTTYMDTLPLELFLQKVIEEVNGFYLLDRGENDLLMEVQKAAHDFYGQSHGDLYEFLEYINHVYGEERGDGIRLMTLHGSKGLEFPVVILYGMNDNISASTPRFSVHGQYGLSIESELSKDKYERVKELEAKEREEEEQRLLYVGMTRAAERLILVGDFEKTANQSYYSMMKKIFSEEQMPLCDFHITKDSVQILQKEEILEDYRIVQTDEYQYSENFSVSDFLLFRQSPVAYYDKIYRHIEEYREHVGNTYLVEPRMRGNIVHQFAQQDRGGEISPQLKKIFSFYHEPWSEEKEREVMEYCQHFRLLNQGKNKYRELEFYYDFHGFPLHGYIDLVNEVSGGVEIIELKTSDLSEEEMKAIYLPQLVLYALVYEQLSGESVCNAKIYSLKRGEIITIRREELKQSPIQEEFYHFLTFVTKKNQRKKF